MLQNLSPTVCPRLVLIELHDLKILRPLNTAAPLLQLRACDPSGPAISSAANSATVWTEGALATSRFKGEHFGSWKLRMFKVLQSSITHTGKRRQDFVVHLAQDGLPGLDRNDATAWKSKSTSTSKKNRKTEQAFVAVFLTAFACEKNADMNMNLITEQGGGSTRPCQQVSSTLHACPDKQKNSPPNQNQQKLLAHLGPDFHR